MQVFVINLDEQTERMEFQAKQLASLGLQFERVPAVKIDSTDDPLYMRHSRNWKQVMSQSEVACFLSHYNIWKLIAGGQSPALILEDDAWLAPETKEVLGHIEVLEAIDYINLEVREKSKKRLLAKKAQYTFGDTSLFHLYQGRSGAAGYVLWQTGATKLLNRADRKGIALADKFLNSCYELGAYQTEPAPLIQLDQCAAYGLRPPLQSPTSIKRKYHVELSLIEKIGLRRKRLITELHVGLNLVKNLHKGVKRSVIPSPGFKIHNGN